MTQFVLEHPLVLAVMTILFVVCWIAEKVNLIRWIFEKPKTDMEREREKEREKKR